jgi:hypothetical protein
MGLADTLIPLIPSAFEGVRKIVEMATSGNPGAADRAGTIVDFAQDLAMLAVTAHHDGLDDVAVMQAIGDLYADALRKLKTGIP